MTKNEVIALIEQAFADTVYPGDEHLTEQTTPERIKIAYEFRGKSWKSLIDAEFPTQNPFALSLFKPEAFRYYLPGFMILAIKGSAVPEANVDFLEAALSPPETEGIEAEDYFNTFGETHIDYWTRRVSGFTTEQKQAIKAYVEYDFPRTWSMSSMKQEYERALTFWETFEG